MVALISREAENFQGSKSGLEFLGIIHAVDGGAARAVQEGVVRGGGKLVLGLVSARQTSEELVEDVEATLVGALLDDTRLLEQIDDDRSTRDESGFVEGYLDEFTETRRVVVLVGLGVTKSFQERVGLEQLLLQLTLSTRSTGDGSQVLNDLLGVFGLTSTRLTTGLVKDFVSLIFSSLAKDFSKSRFRNKIVNRSATYVMSIDWFFLS